jgi:hypothetical protein
VKRIAAVVLLLAFVAGAAAWRLADVKPDPNVQAAADGCQRDTTKIYTGFAPNWVYVNDRDYPASGPPPAPRWVSGTVEGATGLLASRVASSDDPITHSSYDVNIDVTVDPQDDFLTGVSRDTTPEAGTIHMERETAYFPQWAWPQPGDHVQAYGSWVWDCDHYQGRGEQTEFHPFRAAWVVRNTPATRTGATEGDLVVSTDATPAGQEAECAHRTKGADTFKSCAHAAAPWLSVNGTYDLPICALGPRPPGASLVLKVADVGSVAAPRVAVTTVGASCAAVRFTVAAPAGQTVRVLKKVFVGWSKPQPVVHLRVRYDRLLVRRAMDPSCPQSNPACPSANETTLLGQIGTAPGEWQLYTSAAGHWQRWPGTMKAKDGSVFRSRLATDFYLRPKQSWTLVALARECDFGALPGWNGPGHPTAPCPSSDEIGNAKGDDYPGAIAVTYHSLALGTHVVNASTAGSTCPPSNTHGCYQLTYTVSRLR